MTPSHWSPRRSPITKEPDASADDLPRLVNTDKRCRAITHQRILRKSYAVQTTQWKRRRRSAGRAQDEEEEDNKAAAAAAAVVIAFVVKSPGVACDHERARLFHFVVMQRCRFSSLRCSLFSSLIIYISKPVGRKGRRVYSFAKFSRNCVIGEVAVAV